MKIVNQNLSNKQKRKERAKRDRRTSDTAIKNVSVNSATLKTAEIIADFERNGFQVVELDSFAKLPNPGLRSFFSKTWIGNDVVYTTPWISSKDTPEIYKEATEILNSWMPHLTKLEGSYPTLVEFEKDLAAKVGPLSIQKGAYARLDDMKAYYEDILKSAEPIDEQAINAVIQEFNPARGLRMRSAEKTLNKMKKSTSSGLPLFVRKRTVADKTLNSLFALQAYGYSNEVQPVEIFKVAQGENEVYMLAAILGWRGQEGGMDDDDVKQRVVWMFPFKVSIKELQVYQPLIETIQKFKLIPAYVSSEEVDLQITMLFDTKGPDDLVICTDFTKFDQHFNKQMQNAAKSILTALLAKGHDEEKWLNDIFPIKYNIPLLVTDWEIKRAIVRFGEHGMGSGSGGTNLDESLSHRALQHEAALRNGVKLNPHSMDLGDDGVLSFPGITVEKVIECYTAHGLDMNESKQYASKHDCVYLRRWHSDSYRVNGKCVGVYSTCRALGRLLFQERYMDPDDYPKDLDRSKMIALRELSIIENCKYHPLFEEFAEFCMKRDKYRLGIDIPGFLDNIEKYARKASDYMPDFLGYTKTLNIAPGRGSGIAGWRIVQYLKSKA